MSSAARRSLTFKEMLEFTLATVDRKRLLVPLPWQLAKVTGFRSGTVAEALAHHRPGRAPQDATMW